MIEELNFSEVEIDIEESSYIKKLFIDFKIKNIYYYLVLLNKDGHWEPSNINHDYYKNNQSGTCPICNANIEISYCEVLMEYKKEIYKVLLEHPSIRIRSLFYGLEKKKGEKW